MIRARASASATREVQCGYFQVYLTATGMLQEVAQNWSKVPER